jgi:1,2-diacylglycerol 3-alpha-glucosyltransferase
MIGTMLKSVLSRLPLETRAKPVTLEHRPLRIAVFTDAYLPQINGVVTSVTNMVQGLRELGHEVTVVAPKHPQQVPEAGVIRLRSTAYRPQPEQRWAFPPSLRKMWQFNRLHFDVIHTHGALMPILAIGVGRLLSIPVVHTYHTRFRDYIHYAPFYATLSWLMTSERWYARSTRTGRRVTRQLKKGLDQSTKTLFAVADVWFCNRCLELITPAAPMALELDQMGVRTRVTVVPNGIDLERLTAPQADPFPALGIPEGTSRLLSVSRLGKEKSVDLLLERFKLIHNEQPNSRLVIVGDGPERKNLEKLSLEMGLKEAVIFTGYVNATDVGRFYQHSDVFVFASTSETQGLVALEAAACGCPVVARAEMGIISCVLDGETGFLVHPNDKEAFAEKTLRLMTDSNLRAKFSSRAATWAAQEGSHRTMTNRILEVYKRAIAEFEGYDDLRLPPEFANFEETPNAVDAQLERFK